MAKIDTSKIAGYSAMSAEEKLAVLEGFEIEDNSSEIDNYKKMISKANTEAAEWKRKHNALLSEEEQAKVAREAEYQEMKDKLASLEKEKTVATYNASFAAMGYEAELATKTATALADGKMNEVFAYMKQHGEAQEKALRAEILKDTPAPEVGGRVSGEITKEDFAKMGYAEKVKIFNENPELYKELSE